MTKQILSLMLIALSFNVNAAGALMNWSGKVKSVAVLPTNIEVKSGYLDYDLDQKHVRENLDLDHIDYTAPTLEKDQLIVYQATVPMLSLEL
ncbi:MULTISPECIES: hypothetical protein [Vibrio]|uniref:Uncharacterized protein n=1 Tax=Vibrio jasicida TaxID=766224 RepID=A0AAU9QY13_9VIBR|nr:MULTISPECIES: hypothetical protein [Vibrio]KIP73056.1 hypothetical protein SN11_14965 [Vibrio harveyi]PMO48900.1 hypothetical protein BCT11_26450 [Vibrio sp. 10N.222.52.B12]PQJ70261.1 hypothetical protein BTO01_02795 [Vibrio jasicida]CAH1602180.1 conserved exported hypothetical protein [Vibrio jasicida]CAH1603328.1 conserved exported hypothetical protein [Vibrio jasicida]